MSHTRRVATTCVMGNVGSLAVDRNMDGVGKGVHNMDYSKNMDIYTYQVLLSRL